MKTVIIATVTLILVLTIVIANSFLVAHGIETIIEKLTAIQDDTNKLEAYQTVYDDYMKCQRYIGFTVSHDDLTNIEGEFHEILGAIKANDEESLIIAKSRLIGALKHLKRLSGINADSII